MAAQMIFDAEQTRFVPGTESSGRTSGRNPIAKLIELVTGTSGVSVWPDRSDRQRYAESRATASQCEWEELEAHFVARDEI